MRRLIQRIATLCLPVSLAITTLSALTGTAASGPADVDRMIARIRSEPSAQERAKNAVSLAELVRQASEKGELHTISDTTIDDLAGLLKDDDEAGNFWVAGALGLIGSRAGRAVPALEAAHGEACAEARSRFMIFGPQYFDAIEVALERIAGSAPDCMGWKQLQR